MQECSGLVVSGLVVSGQYFFGLLEEVRTMRWSLAVVCTMVVGSAAAQPPPGGMSREDKEAFLKTARVVSMKDVGEGATHPVKAVLDDGKTRMPAIFKTQDLLMKTPSKFGGEKAEEYADSYKYEIAAYELDKLLKLNMLPVIVERTIDGKRGAMREWIEDVMPHYGHGSPPPDMGWLRDWTHTVWLFDYLIYNADRRVHNLLIGTKWYPVLIDHSMVFTSFEKPFRPMYRFPREVVEGLRALDQATVKKALGRYLRPRQIDALMRRRQIILDRVDRQVAAQGEAEALFALPGMGK